MGIVIVPRRHCTFALRPAKCGRVEMARVLAQHSFPGPAREGDGWQALPAGDTFVAQTDGMPCRASGAPARRDSQAEPGNETPPHLRSTRADYTSSLIGLPLTII